MFARIAASKRGDEFYRLHRGDSHLTSASEGDFAYLGDLRFWWRGDPAGMRRIALTSGRVRDKWFTRRGTVDWLDYSIANSLKGPYEVHDPQRATGSRVVFDIPDEGAAQDGAGIAAALAERDAVIVRLQAEVERLDGQLGRCGQERERLVAENVALRSENGALREAAAYPDQTVGGIVVDLADYLIARAEKGDTVAHEGGEAVCVVQGQIPTQRSYSTVNRGFNKIMSVGHVPHFTRAIHIANERVEKDIEVPHIYISAEERADRGKLIRRLLPPKPEPKKHGGNRRKFDLPDFGAPVEGPVKIVTEKKRLYSSVVTEKVLKVETLDSHTEYCDEGGYQMTAAEVDQFKEGVGLKVRVPAYRPQPAQQPLAPADAALTAAMSPESFAAWLDEEPPPPIPLHGPRCAVPGCPFPPEEGRLCGRHAATCAMTGAD